MAHAPYEADRYLTFDEIAAFCRSAAETYPEWVSLEPLGHTAERRPILLLTISRQDSDVRQRPGFWLDGATHASEWTGVAACVLAVQRWLDALADGDVDEVRWFSNNVAYVVPVISADGYAHTLRGGPPVRSTLRPPRDDRPRVGLSVQDVDGDGECLWMRWKHPTGPYVIDAGHPAGFRPRTIDDDVADACYVSMEGRFLAWDGTVWRPASREFGLDLNRNFPGSWAPRSMWGQDAGAYALSEPESRAVMDAVRARPRIAAGLTMHTFTGALLTQPYGTDSPLGDDDIVLMERLGKDAVEGTGYRVLRVVPDFTYDKNKPIGGVWARWIVRGGTRWTVSVDGGRAGMASCAMHG